MVTCGVTKGKEDLGFRLISKLNRYSGELIVVGCLPEIFRKRLELEFKGRFFSTQNLDQIDSLFEKFQIKYADIPDSNSLFKSSFYYEYVEEFLNQVDFSIDFLKKIINVFKMRILGVTDFLSGGKLCNFRISDGCSQNCTFCAILKPIGKHKSKSLEVL